MYGGNKTCFIETRSRKKFLNTSETIRQCLKKSFFLREIFVHPVSRIVLFPPKFFLCLLFLERENVFLFQTVLKKPFFL